MTTSVSAWLDFALLQCAAESYLHKVSDFSDEEQIREFLKIGNNDPIKLGMSADSPILPGATRFTDTQAQWFTDTYDIVTHYPNDSFGVRSFEII